MSTLLQLGAFGGGFLQGKAQGEDRQEVLAQRGREKSRREAAERANEAARQAMNEHRSAFEKSSQPQTEERISLGTGSAAGQEGMAPDLGGGRLGIGPSADFQPDASGLGARAGLTLGMQDKPIPRETVTTKPAAQYDEREGILSGLTAHRRALQQSGADMEVWGKSWTQEQAARNALRADALNKASQAYRLTGDFPTYAKTVYPKIEDGMTILDVQPSKTLDGNGGWTIKRRNDATGEESTSAISEQNARMLAATISDPKALAQYELKAAIAEAMTNERIRATQRAEEAKGEREAGTEDIKQKNRKDLQAQRDAAAAARKGMVTGDKRASLSKPLTLGEGQILVKPDGKGEFKQVAEGKAKTKGSTSSPSAANRVMDERATASAAIRANPAAAAQIRARFKERTGKDLE